MEKPTGKSANIVIHCSDPRVVKWLVDVNWRSQIDLSEGFSAIAATGSVKFFLNEGIMDKLFKELDILTGHFNPEKIIMINHTDCGYYKSLDQNEEKFYFEDIKIVEKQLIIKYPQIKIEGYLLETNTGKLKSHHDIG